MHLEEEWAANMKRGVSTSASIAVLWAIVVAGLGCPHPGRAQTAPETLRRSNDPSLQRTPNASAGHSNRHALLVGCTKYDNRPESSLKGPANDVELMRDVLERNFHFDPKNIVVLCERAGGESRPVHKAIKREFRALAERTQRGDEVLVLLSGHGSQQPDDHDPPKKLDGLEQIFLAADIGIADKATGKVPNAITGDDLNQWISGITAKGAHVFVVVDACHSGTMLRGDVEVSREIPPDHLVPRESLDAAHERGRRNPRSVIVDQSTMTGLAAALQGSVALYAAKADETAPERPMSDDGQTYGVLTFTLCQLLEHSANSGTPLTYRELAARLQSKYLAMGRLNGPTPFAEAAPSDLDREVLGSAVHLGRSRIVLSRNSDNAPVINVGRLHGITKDSILAVYPPAGQSDSKKVVGYAIVTECGVLESQVAPAGHNDVAEQPLPASGTCNLVKLDFGQLRIPIAVDDGGKQITEQARDYAAHLSPAQRATLAKLQTDLQERTKKSESLFAITSDLSLAKWVVQYRKGLLTLLPTDASQSPESAVLRKGTPVYPIAEREPADEVARHLATIAQAQNLLDIASNTRSPLSATKADGGEQTSDSEEPCIQVELVKCKGPNDRRGEVMRLLGKEPELRPGDYLAFRVTNVGRVPTYFTLLFVDNAFAIKAVYPRMGENNLLEAKGNADTISFQTKAFRVNDTTTGHEQLVAIAVRAETGKSPVDFSFLAQKSADAAQRSITTTRGSEARTSFDSPLGQLLRHAVYRSGTSTRGLTDSQLEQYDAKLVSWNVVK